jgi:hypothetical protein
LPKFKLPLVLSAVLFLIANKKNKERIEWLVWKISFRNFKRHPMVSDECTNPDIGHGNGMARTTGETILFFLLFSKLRKNYRLVAGIDLGCGDGVVLKYFKISGLRQAGIEYDESLSRLAQFNNPDAIIITGDFTNEKIIAKTLISLDLDNPTIKNEGWELLVYAFNPIVPEKLLDSLDLIAKRRSFILILKNPNCLPLLLGKENYEVVKFLNKGNLALIKVTKFCI